MYTRVREIWREDKSGGEGWGRAGGEGEAASPLNREPDMGFNPRTLGL